MAVAAGPPRRRPSPAPIVLEDEGRIIVADDDARRRIREPRDMTIPMSYAPLHRPAGTGDIYWGPGDLYRFLVTGEESGGAYFAMEALVPPLGGPPPHIHTNEDETFYVLEGDVTFRLGEEIVVAGPGDFVHVPRGNVHNFTNRADTVARIILTFTPAGIEKFFEETLQRAAAFDAALEPPEPIEAVAARYAEAAPRYGMQFLDG